MSLSELLLNNPLNPKGIYLADGAVCLIFLDEAAANEFKRQQIFAQQRTLFQGPAESIEDYWVLKLNSAPWNRLVDGPLQRYHSTRLSKNRETFITSYGIADDAPYFPCTVEYRQTLAPASAISTSVSAEPSELLKLTEQAKNSKQGIAYKPNSHTADLAELREVKHQFVLKFKHRRDAERFLIDSQLDLAENFRNIIEVRTHSQGQLTISYAMTLTKDEFEEIFTQPFYLLEPNQTLTFDDIQETPRIPSAVPCSLSASTPLAAIITNSTGDMDSMLATPSTFSNFSPSSSGNESVILRTDSPSPVENQEEDEISQWAKMLKAIPFHSEADQLSPLLENILEGYEFKDIPTEVLPLLYLKLLQPQIEKAHTLNEAAYKKLEAFFNPISDETLDTISHLASLFSSIFAPLPPPVPKSIEQRILLALLYSKKGLSTSVKQVLASIQTADSIPPYLIDPLEALKKSCSEADALDATNLDLCEF